MIHVKRKASIQPVTVTMDLRGEEAMLLRGILNMIGGNPNSGSPRAFTESIQRALEEQGVGSYDLGDSVGIDLPARWADLMISNLV